MGIPSITIIVFVFLSILVIQIHNKNKHYKNKQIVQMLDVRQINYWVKTSVGLTFGKAM